MSEDTNNTNGRVFCLPDLGEGLSQAEIVVWHVQPGDRVVADQPLVTVETDKAVVDIPAPHAGSVESITVQSGDVVAVGEVLLQFASSDAASAASVVGVLPEAPVSTPKTLKASPRARQRAAELGVPLENVTASGPGGVIQLSDVEAAPRSAQLVPLRGARAAMAARMTDAHARVVRATVTGEADISVWNDPVAVMPRLIRAVVSACQAQPTMNAAFDDQAMTLRLQSDVHLGIAMETPDGLFVPTLRHAGALNMDETQAALDELREAAAQRTLKPEQLRGQTITISNFGAVGGRLAEMIVVPPQVAIVGAGRSYARLKLTNGEAGEGLVLPLSVSFDHRVITGVEACVFLEALIQDLERET